MNAERWSKVVVDNYEGYEISDRGRIRRNGNVLATQEDKDGYFVIVLTQNQVKKLVKIHRLVAEYFVEKTEGYNIVNHKDGDKKNNNSSNLEWTTVQLNTQHAYDTGLYKNLKRVCIKYKTGEIKSFVSCKEASRQSGISYATINGILNGSRNGKRAYNNFNIEKIFFE